MELLGRIFLIILVLYFGNYFVSMNPEYKFDIGVAVGSAIALSLTY
jgi:hypothetical protein